jgi:hypothetical protein
VRGQIGTLISHKSDGDGIVNRNCSSRIECSKRLFANLVHIFLAGEAISERFCHLNNGSAILIGQTAPRQPPASDTVQPEPSSASLVSQEGQQRVRASPRQPLRLGHRSRALLVAER